jgi:hypothetical protein
MFDRAGAGSEEAVAVLGPGPQAGGITGTGFAESLTADQFIAERIGPRLDGPSGRPRLGRFLFPIHLDRGRGDRNRHEDDGAEPGEHLSIHG